METRGSGGRVATRLDEPDGLEAVLREHVLDAWFPRSLDLEHGGFLTAFDHRWRPHPRQDKLLEFQARQTLFAAEAARAFPDDEGVRAAALHGARYLRERMWDREEGGWFHRLDREGRPLEGATKHAHGAAYGIEACAAVFEATGDPAWLAHAREGFDWLERCAHDARNGGWFGPTDRAGKPLLDPAAEAAASPGGRSVDTIGTPFGRKDVNVHSDLLETFLHFRRVASDARVEERLEEALDVVARRMIDPATGGLAYSFAEDLTPVPRTHRASVEFQTAHRLLLARERLGVARARDLARGLVKAAMRRGRDRERGGYFLVDRRSSRTDPHSEGGFAKAWWVQTEALRAFLCLAQLDPEEPRWRELYDEQQRYLLRHYVDRRHGGFFPVGLDAHPLWRRHPRLAPAWATDKATVWKDASHEGRALLFCLERAPVA